ncbi:MAG: hypothetical protein GY772_20950, partial [bacterium]|nr:hypothetical protein [bacterium]
CYGGWESESESKMDSQIPSSPDARSVMEWASCEDVEWILLAEWIVWFRDILGWRLVVLKITIEMGMEGRILYAGPLGSISGGFAADAS